MTWNWFLAILLLKSDNEECQKQIDRCLLIGNFLRWNPWVWLLALRFPMKRNETKPNFQWVHLVLDNLCDKNLPFPLLWWVLSISASRNALKCFQRICQKQNKIETCEQLCMQFNGTHSSLASESSIFKHSSNFWLASLASALYSTWNFSNSLCSPDNLAKTPSPQMIDWRILSGSINDVADTATNTDTKAAKKNFILYSNDWVPVLAKN